MHLPGFHAESALGPARHHYRGRVRYPAGGSPIAPQQELGEDAMDLDDEMDDEMDEDMDDNDEVTA